MAFFNKTFCFERWGGYSFYLFLAVNAVSLTVKFLHNLCFFLKKKMQIIMIQNLSACVKKGFYLQL